MDTEGLVYAYTTAVCSTTNCLARAAVNGVCVSREAKLRSGLRVQECTCTLRALMPARSVCLVGLSLSGC